MKALLYKQLRLVCHPMTPVFCLFGIMVIIPNYPYTVILVYVTRRCCRCPSGTR